MAVRGYLGVGELRGRRMEKDRLIRSRNNEEFQKLHLLYHFATDIYEMRLTKVSRLTTMVQYKSGIYYTHRTCPCIAPSSFTCRTKSCYAFV